MARLVVHDATGPRKLDADDLDAAKGNVAVCQCGLSAEYPFCDGSHRGTAGETPGVLYRYEGDDDANPRHPVDRVVLEDE